MHSLLRRFQFLVGKLLVHAATALSSGFKVQQVNVISCLLDQLKVLPLLHRQILRQLFVLLDQNLLLINVLRQFKLDLLELEVLHSNHAFVFLNKRCQGVAANQERGILINIHVSFFVFIL